MNETIEVGAIYRHQNGKDYKVLSIAIHEADKKPFVVYQALYNDSEYGENAIWCRDLNNFLSLKESKPRFTKISI